MADYEFEGTIDKDGNVEGTIREINGYSGGPLPIFSLIIIYGLCIMGGIFMLKNVVNEAPICIIPAILAFLVMLLPIIKATKTENFFVGFIVTFIKWSDLLIGLLLIMFWIFYIFKAVSTTILMAMGIGLLYLTIVTIVRSISKVGVFAGIATIVIPFITYLIILACSDDFLISYYAIIPTVSIMISLFISELVNLVNPTNRKKWSFFRILVYIGIVISLFSLNSVNTGKKEDLLQIGKDYISEGKYSEAREVLQDLKFEEAKDLYASIRYKNIQVGEIIYNGYYEDSDARSASEGAFAFVCLDIIDGKALFISLDVIRLDENYSGGISEQYYVEDNYFDMNNIETITIGYNETKLFLLSKEQYDLYIQNNELKDYLIKCDVSDWAKDQKKEIDKDNYKWTLPYIEFWLLNDFTADNYIGTINCLTGEHKYEYNYKVYAGIRVCYYANIS